MRGTVSFPLALLAFAGACSSGDPVTADPRPDIVARELGNGPAGVYVLRSIAGRTLPAVIVSHESYNAVMLADTIFLHADGTGGFSSVQRVTEDPAQGERTDRDQNVFTYALSGSRLTAEFRCPDLGACLAAPHYVGTVSANALRLEMALNYRVPLEFAKVAGPSDVAEVRISPSPRVVITEGGTGQLSAAAFDANGGVLAGKKFAWAALSPSVATVDQRGALRAVVEGDAAVVAFVEGRADTVVVRVDRR